MSKTSTSKRQKSKWEKPNGAPVHKKPKKAEPDLKLLDDESLKKAHKLLDERKDSGFLLLSMNPEGEGYNCLIHNLTEPQVALLLMEGLQENEVYRMARGISGASSMLKRILGDIFSDEGCGDPDCEACGDSDDT